MAIVISGTTGIDAGSLPVSNCGNTEVEGNLNLSGVGARITGDFSSTTVGNRLGFQSSVANGLTAIEFIPNGTSNYSAIEVLNSSDSVNHAGLYIAANGTTSTIINSFSRGTGTALPLAINVAGAERMRIDTAGNVGIGATSNSSRLYVEQLNAANNALTILHNSNLQTQKIVSIVNGVNGGTEVLKIDGAGSLLLTSGTGGLGYGTGAGGTVTQLTSKSTAVTLNKPSGTIIMNNAALAASSSVAFRLYNSLCSNGDVCVIAPADGNYSVIGIVENGSVYIRVTNITAYTLSDVLFVKYAIIKGVQS